jgi:hypothetical protein
MPPRMAAEILLVGVLVVCFVCECSTILNVFVGEVEWDEGVVDAVRPWQ